MDISIHFNDQICLVAEKIDDKSCDDLLPPKMDAINTLRVRLQDKPLSRLPLGGEANTLATKLPLVGKYIGFILNQAPFPFGKGGGMGLMLAERQAADGLEQDVRHESFDTVCSDMKLYLHLNEQPGLFERQIISSR